MSLPARKQDFDHQLREEIAELGGEDFGTLLKFDANDGKYRIDKQEVPEGREYVAHVPQYARGWTKFIDKKPVARRIFKLPDGQPPERDELDELDRADRDGDPWVFQRFLPLEDLETGEIAVFASKSVGGKIALNKLLQTYAANQHRGLPIVRLGAASFPTQSYGDRRRPDFKVVNWSRNEMQEIAGSLDYDQSDPGFDPDSFSR